MPTLLGSPVRALSARGSGPRARPVLGAARRLSAALLVLSAAAAQAGQPGPGQEPFRLLYRSTDGCPTAASVEQQFLARAPRLRPAALGEAATTVAISVREQGGHAAGELVIETPAGSSSLREMTGERCADVAQALALVAALALSPMVEPPAEEAPPPPPPLALPPPLPSESKVIPRGNSDPTSSWSLGLRGGGMTAVAPWLSWGASVWGEREGGGRRWALRAGALWAGAGQLSPGSRTARFEAYLASLEACARWPAGGVVSFDAPCAGLEIGALRAEGADVGDSRSAFRPWASPTLSARARVGAGGGTFAEADGGMFAPLVRDRFVFEEPAEVIHRPAALGVRFGFSVGMTIW